MCSPVTLWTGCNLITPLDLLKCVGAAPPFGSAARPTHYALLLEVLRDVLPSLGLLQTTTASKPAAVAAAGNTDAETSTAVAVSILNGAATLVEGACESHALAAAASASASASLEEGGSAAVHLANLAAALAICIQLFSTPRFNMLLKIGAHRSRPTFAKLEAAWHTFQQQEGKDKQLPVTLATQLDLRQGIAALAYNTKSTTTTTTIASNTSTSTSTNGVAAPDASGDAKGRGSGTASAAATDTGGPAVHVGNRAHSTALEVLAMIEATRCHTPTHVRAKQWCFCADWDNIPLSEMLSTMWLVGLNELAACATRYAASSKSTPSTASAAAAATGAAAQPPPPSRLAASLSLPASPHSAAATATTPAPTFSSSSAAARWLYFLCIRVPALARAFCSLKPGTYGSAETRSQHTTAAVTEVRNQAGAVLTQLQKVLGCDMVVELECGSVANELLPLRESPSKLRLLTSAECGRVVAGLAIGDDPSSVNWRQVSAAIDGIFKSDGMVTRVFEGLYAWDKLRDFLAALRRITATADALPASSMESLAAYSNSLLLCRFLERRYSVSPAKAYWACTCSSAAKDLVDKLIEIAFAVGSGDDGAGNAGSSALKSIVCADGPGVALLEGAGVYLGSQLVAAQAAGAIMPEQYQHGAQQLASQLPTVMLEVVEWLAHNLHAGISDDPNHASGKAGLAALAEMVSALKQQNYGGEGAAAAATADTAAELAEVTFAVVESIAKPALQQCSENLDDVHTAMLLGIDSGAAADGNKGDAPMAAASLAGRATGLLDEDAEDGDASGAASVADLLRACSSSLTVNAVGALVGLARDGGTELFVRAATDELLSGVRFESMCKTADIAAIVAILVDDGTLASLRPVFSDILPSACHAITATSHGVALASFTVRLVASLISVASDATDAADTAGPPAKRQKNGGKGGGSTVATAAAAAADASGNGAMEDGASAWSNLKQPVAEIAMLTTLSCDLLNNGPSPAVAFPVALAGQAARFGPSGMLPSSVVGDALRTPQRALARAFRLFDKTECAAPFFDLTADTSAEDAAALCRMRPLPASVAKTLPFIPSLSDAW